MDQKLQAFLTALQADDVPSVREALRRDAKLARREMPQGSDGWQAKGWTPLHMVAWNGSPGALALLLEYGADINARDRGGRTALHNAIEAGGVEVRDLLLERGAEVDVCAAAILPRIARLLQLMKQEPALARDTRTGLSPLGWAAFGNRPDSAHVLLENGADASEINPLFCAAAVNGFRFLRVMLDKGADPDARNDKHNLLHEAVLMRYTCDSTLTVKLLLERGANVNIVDAEGRTPLDHARAGADREAFPHPSAPSQDCKRFDKVIELLGAHGGVGGEDLRPGPD